ncbi:Pfam:Acid phosphat A [Geosmithia morbida]|uniref:Pfam:Acid phosphat A n=1 Tax=Geosmithia morbida TaxID=1094350 RepID=A0A9P5D507_9HYPO|nr:Pfam:Acid phosphat A [Geosmithia morbida]KAF4124081.1 Pfam:Acid phosphat A [Geosmithia morbida]
MYGTTLQNILLGFSAMASLAAAEEVLGVYIFHRHGDRTAKAWKPVNLTSLGADQVHASGAHYHDRYVSSQSDLKIQGLSSDVAVLSQLSVVSADDAVLYGSALTFMQGLYPPTGHSEELANGTSVEGPLGGYQYIPVEVASDAASGSKAESNTWLQGSSGCSKAEISSNSFLSSELYARVRDESASFFESLHPVVASTFSEDDMSFENAYDIYDLVNVATIHNSSVAHDDLLTDAALGRLFGYASVQQWNLAFNESEAVRAISGAVLGGQILEALQAVVDGDDDAATFNVQFGSYGTFMSFFGLAQLQKADSAFESIVDYASSMAFELVSNVTENPTADDISVRFVFANGTSAQNELTEYPLFGQSETTISWADFRKGMSDFSITSDEQWCKQCGNSDGQCSSLASSSSSDESGSGSGGSSNGISKPVAGVIGALVTLAVVLGLEAAFMLIGGFTLVRKSALAAVSAGAASSQAAGEAKA